MTFYPIYINVIYRSLLLGTTTQQQLNRQTWQILNSLCRWSSALHVREWTASLNEYTYNSCPSSRDL